MDAEINILETNFEITLEGFATEEEANNIGRFTLEAIRALNNNLNLEISKLKCIVISYNFSEALQKITSTYQHKSPSSYTNSELREGAGAPLTSTAKSTARFGTIFHCVSRVKIGVPEPREESYTPRMQTVSSPY